MIEYIFKLNFTNYSDDKLDEMFMYCIQRFGIDSTIWGGWTQGYSVIIFRFYSEEDRTEFKLTWAYDTDELYN